MDEGYIEKNIELRKAAQNDFEKDFFKLMNNSVFSRTMMNVRKNVDIRLVSETEKYTKLVSKPNFEKSTFFVKDLAAVHLRKTEVKFNQPIYIGMTILDISQTLMYNFYYKILKRKYDDKIKLLYIDTDSLTIEIKTENFYEDMKDMITEFDTSDYPKDNIYVIKQLNKKIRKVTGFSTPNRGPRFSEDSNRNSYLIRALTDRSCTEILCMILTGRSQGSLLRIEH